MELSDLSGKSSIGAGRLAAVFDWEPNQVIKIFKEGVREPEVQHEYEVSKGISEIYPHSPKVFEIVKNENNIGIVFEKVRGNTMVQDMPKYLLRLKKLAKKFAELHFAMHEYELEALPDYLDKVEARIMRSTDMDEAAKKKVIDHLHQLPKMNRIGHGDYHPDNIIIQDGELVVIDWVTASKGHPLFDVARTSFMLEHAGAPTFSRLQNLMINFIRKRFHSHYLAHYLDISGFTKAEMDQYYLPMMVVRLQENIPEERELLLEKIDEQLAQLD